MTNDQFLEQHVLPPMRDAHELGKLAALRADAIAEHEPAELEGTELFQNLRRINQPAHFDIPERDDSYLDDPRRS